MKKLVITLFFIMTAIILLGCNKTTGDQPSGSDTTTQISIPDSIAK